MKIGNAPPIEQSGEGGDWRNPNSIVRNTVRIREGEMCMFTFIQDLLEGDCSLFHTVTETLPNGNTAFPRYYCARNENEDGFVISDQCEYCDFKDTNVKKRPRRYSYWVYLYNVYHKTQNPRLEQYPDAETWTPTPVGQKNYFVEAVNKPQLLQLSTTVWNSLEEEASMIEDGEMVGSMFRYSHIIDSNRRHSYTIKESRMKGISPVDSDDLVIMQRELPELELVVSGQISEFEFGSFASTEAANNAAEDEAYNRVQASVDDY